MVFLGGHRSKYWPPSRCVQCVNCVQYSVPLCQVFVISARLGNWLLLLHLVIAADITGHGITSYNATQTHLTSLCTGDAQSSIEVTHYIQTATKFTDSERMEGFGWPCLYRELNHGTPAWTRMSEHTQEPANGLTK